MSRPASSPTPNVAVIASLVYCGAAFGGAFLFMRMAAPELPALVVAFLRVAIASLILLPFVGRARLAAMRESWRHYAFVGLFMAAIPFALFSFAERSITAGMGSIINATTPLWTAMILVVWARQPLTARRVGAIAIGFSGVGIIVGLGGLHLTPDALVGVIAATIAAASYGIALTYIRRRMGPQPPIQLAAGQLIAATLMLLPFAAASVGEVTITTEAVVAVLGISILSTAIAWPILFRLNRDVGPMATSTVTFLNPVFGVLWGALFLSESISPTFLLGSVLVFASLTLILGIRPLELVRTVLEQKKPTTVPVEAED